MGYKIAEKTARIRFHGSEYEGAEVVCRLDVPMGVVFDLMEAQAEGENSNLPGLFDRFSKEVLMEWNLEDREGNPMPCDLRNVPVGFAHQLISEWGKAAVEPSSPLGQQSEDGNT